MANETKVGLLVGMSFIVVFALLLANRGTKQSPAIVRKPATTRGQIVKPQSVTAVEDRVRNAALIGDPSVLEPSTLNSQTPAAPAVKQAEDQQPATEESSPPASAFQRLEDQMRFSPMPKPSRTELAEGPADLSDWKNESALESVQEPRSVVLRSETEPTTEASSPPVEVEDAPAAADRRHTVRKGETLYKIARDVYGSSSKDVVDQLFNANRSTLKSPNSLQEGDQLVLPSLETLLASQVKGEPASTLNPDRNAEQKKPASAKEPKPAKPDKKKETGKKRADSEKEWRWYQVGKGDRYATIAAKEMGDSRHWQKLAEYNKDIFPDPAKIRPGVRIRIPAEQLVSAN